MDAILCSENFRKFFIRIIEGTPSVAEFIDTLSEEIPLISEELNLGRIDLEVDKSLASDDIQSSGAKDQTIFAASSYNYDSKYERSFSTGDNGRINITAFPSGDNEWSESEISALDFLSNILFALYTKTRQFHEIRSLAVFDQLTGVFNREGLLSYCEEHLFDGSLGDYTSIFLNIRNFMYINQNIGTRSADKILKKYASVLMDLACPGIVARVGGDNFVILLHDDDVEEFLENTKVISISMSEFVHFDIQTKAGVYKINPIDTFNDILNSASIAYNVAKKSPNTRVVYFTSEILRQSTLEKDITALFPEALKNHEFKIYFQPKVRMDTGRLYGCEALVRWISSGQVIPPDSFVPVLEREGAICDLDFYMLGETCRCIRYWLDNNIAPVKVSVNFSKLHLRNSHLADEIHDVLKSYNVPTKYIEIELTETSCQDDYTAMIEFIADMRSRGFSVSIDDFGTGYSSLNMLKDIHVDMIKLDKSFVDSIITEDESAENAKIVIRNIVKTILELGMEVIAEGVEKLSQVTFLEEIGCEIAQGYRFGKPMEEGRFTNELISDMG